MTPNPTASKLSAIVQMVICFALLAMFAGVLFLPAVYPNLKVEPDTKQTLFGLVTAVVFFFIGRSTGSAEREAVVTAAAISSTPTVPAAPVKIDDTTPVKVQESPSP